MGSPGKQLSLSTMDTLSKTAGKPKAAAKPRMFGKRRFRALMRLMLSNIKWLGDVGDEELGDSAARNVQVLIRRRDQDTELTLEAKAILRGPSEDRTDSEKQIIYEIIRTIKCFRVFPDDVQRRLASFMFFEFYGPDRTILREGHEPTCMFFIMDGDVAIYKQVYDPVEGKVTDKQVGTMSKGDKFGDAALLYDIRRTATVVTTTVCEMLGIYKKDFAYVLQSTLQSQWDAVKHAMSRFRYFDKWVETLIRESCILSRMLTFGMDETILGDGHGYKNYVYFLVHGQCSVIELLTVEVHSVGSRQVYRLRDNCVPGVDLLPGHKLEAHFMQVCLLNELSVFGIGESMRYRRVVATRDVEFLVLPRDWLMKNKDRNQWLHLRFFLRRKYPSRHQVFQKFVDDRNVLELKQLACLGKTIRYSGTAPQEAPFSLRLKTNNDYYRRGY